MKRTMVLSDDGDFFIELTHRESDPGTWIVKRWKKTLWFKRRISSDWFNDRRQALVFAEALKRETNVPSHTTNTAGGTVPRHENREERGSHGSPSTNKTSQRQFTTARTK